MGRGDEIDVMTLQFVLEIEHLFSQVVNFNFVPSLCFRILAYLVILAEHAPEITVAEKNGTGATSAGKDGFFSVMSNCRRDRGEIGGITESPFAAQAINSTIPGADIAKSQPGFKLFNPFFQLAGTIQRKISRFDCVVFIQDYLIYIDFLLR
jgi:hypothetical protein